MVEKQDNSPERYRVDDLILEVDTFRVLRGSEEIALPRLSFELLTTLVRRAPEILTVDELMDAVWPGLVVGPETVTKRVKLVRDALGDDSHEPTYIGVVRSRGYRVIAPVEPLNSSPTPVDRPADSTRWRSWAFGIGATLVLLAMVTTGVFRLLNETPAERPRVARESPADMRSVAVLPFTDMSADQRNKPFTVGIHDDILTRISQIRALKVISRTSVSRLDGTLDIPDIAKLLGVATILEGGVQRSGDRVRINVQLIDAHDDTHLWADTFDRTINTENIFAIQSEIAQAVAAALEATLSPHEQRRLSTMPTDSFEAHEAYHLGKQAMILRTNAAMSEAATHFTRAIELDPDYALAYVGLATAILLLNYHGDLSLQESLDRSESLIKRALELDEQLAAAHAARGLSFLRQSRGSEASASLERAIELDPNDPQAYHWYGDLLVNGNLEPENALPLLERARELDPLSPSINATIGEAYDGLGRFQDAMTAYRKVIALEPDYPGVYFTIAVLYRFGFGQLDEAVLWHRKELQADPTRNPAPLGFTYLELGDETRAAALFERAAQSHPDQFLTLAGLTALHLYRGDEERALGFARQLDNISPGNDLTIKTFVSFERNEEAIRSFRQLDEQFSCAEIRFKRGVVFQAINVSLAFERTGDADCANRLLDAAFDRINELPRLGGRGFGIADVEIFARQGRKQEALAALRKAIDEGWRTTWWWQGVGSPHTATIAGDPAFIAMIEEVRSELAQQLGNLRRTESNGEAPSSQRAPADPGTN